MKLEVVSYGNSNCHKYGSQILYRSVRFAKKYDSDCVPEVLWHTITLEMAKQNPEMLALAAVENDKVVGHLLCRVINNDGTLICLITQLEIDKKYTEGREDTMIEGMDVIGQFAAVWGCQRVRCWARDDKTAKLFERFGFEPKDYVLMDRALEIEDG
ncbi:MAG: hypothetical protein ACYSWO_24075 [Planctomycetota bacterium]|jgi:hypothetical protein